MKSFTVKLIIIPNKLLVPTNNNTGTILADFRLDLAHLLGKGTIPFIEKSSKSVGKQLRKT